MIENFAMTAMTNRQRRNPGSEVGNHEERTHHLGKDSETDCGRFGEMKRSFKRSLLAGVVGKLRQAVANYRHQTCPVAQEQDGTIGGAEAELGRG
jgi:hypothetical protein